MKGISSALQNLSAALDAPHQDGLSLGNWRWSVRRRMVEVRDALVSEGHHPADGWLAARGGTAIRERNALLARLAVLGPQVLENPDVGRVQRDLKRLVTDVAHHRQRLHDLAYDEVELELGGSE
jgi:hypothetical protein